MYNNRIKVFIILSALLLLICLLRLTQMQLLPDSSLQDEIAELKRQRDLIRQLKTVRGKILDRNGKILATDEPHFQLYISYQLSSYLDERVQQAKLLKAAKQNSTKLEVPNVHKELQAGLEDLQQIIEKCTHFGIERRDIEAQIAEINNKIWNLREYLAWKRNLPNENFVEAVPDANERLLLTAKVDIAEMHKNYPLLELKTDDDIFAAQLEFLNVDGVQISPKAQRFYPYGSVAAQTIGWVGPATQQEDKKLFENDKLASYLDGDVCGREDGVEHVCETILRGRRGEIVYDIDHRLKSRTETQFGEDVSLTLDIELQKKIEDYLASCELNPNCKSPTAVVVIEVMTSDILVLVSIPAFDLNSVRYDYSTLVQDPNEPLRNRAINKQYPPGSVVKPLILIAGLESGKITPDELINCPAKEAPKGWPNCWLYNRRKMGHDNSWENIARNAIKGSCNIYFSRLADRIDPSVLQQWLFRFGYGRKIPLAPAIVQENGPDRDLRQAKGQISSFPPKAGSLLKSPAYGRLAESERRFFGIGQGNLRVTPLQAANAFAAIARGGLYKPPRLFCNSVTASPNSVIASEAKQSQINSRKNNDSESDLTDLNISAATVAVIYDGMYAVVNEPGGTAYNEFAHSGLSEQGIKVYGKTGSTEEPDNAWFGGFATDSMGSKLAIAVVVEGGQHGSSDAAPLARDIIQFCIEAGYIGESSSQ